MPVKEAKLLEGKVLAAKIQEEIKQAIQRAKNALSDKFEPPLLAIIQPAHNPSADWYLSQQKKLASKLEVEFIEPCPFIQPPDQPTLVETIRSANRSKAHGIFITMPLPSNYDSDKILLELDPTKDVEGIHPTNLGFLVLRKAQLLPPTAYAALKLIEWSVNDSKVELRGLKAAIVGQSAVVGRPLQLLLGERRVTTIICNTGTSPSDLQKAVSESDIVVACAGSPGLVRGSWIKEGAIVIDVGTTEIDSKLVGDVEFDEAKKRAAYITPVPGGVGPLTVTMLMKNLITAYESQNRIS